MMHLSSPPQSMQDNLHCSANNSRNKKHSYPLTSTPKYDSTMHSNNHSMINSITKINRLRNVNENGQGSRCCESDNSEEDEDLHRIKSKSKFVSRSLPPTPRSNIINGFDPSFKGYLPETNNSTTLPRTMSLNNNISTTSHYMTCNSNIQNSVEALSEGIDYCSLPLPKEPHPVYVNRKFNRYSSEPSMNQANGSTSLLKKPKNKRRENIQQYADQIEDSSLNDIENRLDDLDMIKVQWKFIRTLVAELNKSRAQNNKLYLDLQQTKLELQTLKCNSEVDASLQPGAVMEMVSQIHAAQRVRDEAMMSRIKLANEERDSALNQAHFLSQNLSHPSTNSDCQTKEEGVLMLEDGMRNLRLTLLNQQNKPLDNKSSKSYCCKHKEVIKNKLDDLSENQLLDKYLQLESLVGTLLQKNDNHSCHESLHKNSSTSDGDPKNSLSSLDSVETMSASSWKMKRPDEPEVSSSGPITEL